MRSRVLRHLTNSGKTAGLFTIYIVFNTDRIKTGLSKKLLQRQVTKYYLLEFRQRSVVACISNALHSNQLKKKINTKKLIFSMHFIATENKTLPREIL